MQEPAKASDRIVKYYNYNQTGYYARKYIKSNIRKSVEIKIVKYFYTWLEDKQDGNKKIYIKNII